MALKNICKMSNLVLYDLEVTGVYITSYRHNELQTRGRTGSSKVSHHELCRTLYGQLSNKSFDTFTNAAVMRNRMSSLFSCSTLSQPFWLQFSSPKPSPQCQPFWVCSCQNEPFSKRGACLGSRPCLHGEPELMVLKWRPDGDRGLIAAEGGCSCVPPTSGCPAFLAKAACFYLLIIFFPYATLWTLSCCHFMSAIIYYQFPDCRLR